METIRTMTYCLLAAIVIIPMARDAFRRTHDKVLRRQLSHRGSWRVFLGRSPRIRGFQRRLNFLITHPAFWPTTQLAADELADQMRVALPDESWKKLPGGLAELEEMWSARPGTASVLEVFGLLAPTANTPEGKLLQHLGAEAPAGDIELPQKWHLTSNGLVAAMYLLSH